MPLSYLQNIEDGYKKSFLSRIGSVDEVEKKCLLFLNVLNIHFSILLVFLAFTHWVFFFQDCIWTTHLRWNPGPWYWEGGSPLLFKSLCELGSCALCCPQILEDIEILTFEKGQWKEKKDENYHHMRLLWVPVDSITSQLSSHPCKCRDFGHFSFFLQCAGQTQGGALDPNTQISARDHHRGPGLWPEILCLQIGT